ncbi:MAG: GH1 family beta-glucosidase [Chloroflexota bacterium]
MIHQDFPDDFLFGTATSAYQIEGGWNADGKGPSIWDAFTQERGKINGNHNGDTACNTYHDFDTDIRIMQQLGMQSYRFSISWPRVLPEGRGAINEAGLDYYDRLVDRLLEAGITPFATLFHWDLPLALEHDFGGFANRNCAFLFADYAGLMAGRLGDRVKHWITLNEPWVHATLGHLRGLHAPGHLNPWAYLRAIHHQLLGHGLATQRIKAEQPDASVGLSLNLAPVYPATDSDRDKAAAKLTDQFINGIYLNSIFKGFYPQLIWNKMRLFHPPIKPGDMEIISYPIDFLGINYYTRVVVKHAWYIPVYNARPANVAMFALKERFGGNSSPGYNQMGWEIYPAGLFELLFRIKKEYGNPPIYITENGAAFNDVIEADGRIHDSKRQSFLEKHTAALLAAIRAGVDVRGYFVWSLLDNFEWAYGYDKRFGLVYVDFDTQERIIKDSGYWYQNLIQSRKVLPLSGLSAHAAD